MVTSVLTPEAVADWYRHLAAGNEPPRVDRYDAPGLHALNFVVHDSLAGGINASTRLDTAAKGMAQMLMRFPIPVPPDLAATIADVQIADTAEASMQWH